MIPEALAAMFRTKRHAILARGSKKTCREIKKERRNERGF